MMMMIILLSRRLVITFSPRCAFHGAPSFSRLITFMKVGKCGNILQPCHDYVCAASSVQINLLVL